jgi:hypothetical protein
VSGQPLGAQERAGPVWRPWLLAWTGGAVLGAANGAVREALLRRVLDEVRARQVSTVTLLPLLTGYMELLQRRWPLRTTRQALAVGAAWAALTAAFDLGLGHYVQHRTWAALLAD